MNSPQKKRMKLSEQTSPISFKLQYDTLSGRYKVIFNDTDDIQNFIDFEDYLYELSLYFRNRMDTEDLVERKLKLCEEFINTLYLYSTDHKKYSKDKNKFDSVIKNYLEQFQYFQKGFQENSNISLIEPPVENGLSLKAQLIILEYLDVVDTILKQAPSHKVAFKLIGKLLDRNEDNVKKGIANLYLIAEKGDKATKTRTTLNNVSRVARETGYLLIEDKTKADFEQLNKNGGMPQ